LQKHPFKAEPPEAASGDLEGYFPPAESAGGWRRAQTEAELWSLAGLNPERLRLVEEKQRSLYAGPWAIIIVRHGYLAQEWYAVPTLPATTFDVWSCTKSATGLAYGMLLEDSRRHRLPQDAQIGLDSPAYRFVPEGQPLSDLRKEAITLRHLLSMTSGIPGEDHGLIGLAVAPGGGEYEIALGREANRFGHSAARLLGEPGTVWDYSDAAFAHLSLIFAHASGQEIADYMQARVFQPAGIENVGWDRQGGAGHIGPHTNAHSGLRLSARDFARLGYLCLRRGRWQEQQIVPAAWLEQATRSSQELNSDYGYTFWTNSKGSLWPGVPRDAFAFKGFASNRCYIVPSLDLVVVRVGYSPAGWPEGALLPAVAAAIVEEPG
jgi:CubicO group peptidase (beta-lactamase class C family)